MRRLIILLFCLMTLSGLPARTIRVYGYIVDADNKGLEFVNAYAGEGADIVGSTSNKNGYYELLLEERDTIELTYSIIGYVTTKQRIVHSRTTSHEPAREVYNINVMMATDEQWLNEVEVRGLRRQTGTMDEIEAQTVRVMPDATGGSIESLLITFAGVNQNNELSSQYNVRGGTFDENVVYVNGIEVHRPLLIRSGQQEGLSFVNPEMVHNLQFSAGGFDARYGDKMSSVLDIEYKRPDRTEASLSASLLGANVYVGHGNEHYSQMHGIRYKTSKYMLGAMQTAGNYNPTYVDYQTSETWQIGNQERPWTLSLLGNVSWNQYEFRPDSMSESFGGTLDTKNLSIWYEGAERDRFITAFAALSAYGRVNREVEIGFDLSGFYSGEQENFDITGEYILSEGDGSARPGEIQVDYREVSESGALAVGTYHEHARNRLTAGVATLAHRGEWTNFNRGENHLRWGVSLRGEWISDHISEWTWRDSAGYSLPDNGTDMQLSYAMKSDSRMNSVRLQTYLENTHTWDTEHGKVSLTAGARLQYWSFNHEVLPSPRASVTWTPGWKRDISFRFASGIYYQAPFYKEVRDTATVGGVTRVTLNSNIKAQRSYQAILGTDYYFRAWGRPFKFSAEAYGKYMDRLESYTVDNVRVRYSGKNDARGYTVGLDLKLYGELVPGADSWISFSTMRNRMQLIDHPEAGWLLNPQEQRYSFSMLFQDYIPQLPQLRFHLKMIWSDGLPFSSPRNMLSQSRMSPYRRIDLGATWVFDRKTAAFMRAESARHIRQWAIQAEVFNVVGWRNVNSYFWISDGNGQQWASPNYLTGRRFNVKITVDIQ